ncbi:hypothetical protein [Actinoplanes sp. NBRC 103695]|uniref:hypothetical protein n=1 Tax=Actinoplanes sp. NBRC 103695 TaxID=3032202 RepID=UPI0024A104BE|nr:hypothetical protein [Actinoplanes sp. NBRC 103695]GLY93543.1 hypothetical protein Acsp02_07990 [Actinoplanes sp. NBRC 103695]
MRSAAARTLAAVVLAAMMAGGCDDPEPPASAPSVSIAWQPATLSASDAIMLRESTSCGGAFFVVGALRDKAGGTRPAAWMSRDGATWSPMTFAPKTFYGKQHIMYAVACANGRLAALGAKIGGAHSNPRTSSWQQSPDGVLREVTAPFELFGGPQALNVSRLTAGPSGFLISGNRMSGAAAWVSPDGTSFSIVERARQLASDQVGETYAFDAAALPPGWIMVGGIIPEGRIDRDPMGWRSPDGRAWTRLQATGATEDYDELQRVAVLDGVPVAVGLRGATFGAWQLDGDTWRPAGAFGAVPPGAGTSVRSLVVSNGRLLAVTATAQGYAGWVSADRGGTWRQVSLPIVPPGADHAVSLTAASDGRLLLVTDDGQNARVYLAETPA